MVTALVSLTWDIKGQPNCAQKQVIFVVLCTCHRVFLYNLSSKFCAERYSTFPTMGNDARSCDAYTK